MRKLSQKQKMLRFFIFSIPSKISVILAKNLKKKKIIFPKYSTIFLYCVRKIGKFFIEIIFGIILAKNLFLDVSLFNEKSRMLVWLRPLVVLLIFLQLRGLINRVKILEINIQKTKVNIQNNKIYITKSPTLTNIQIELLNNKIDRFQQKQVICLIEGIFLLSYLLLEGFFLPNRFFISNGIIYLANANVKIQSLPIYFYILAIICHIASLIEPANIFILVKLSFIPFLIYLKGYSVTSIPVLPLLDSEALQQIVKQKKNSPILFEFSVELQSNHQNVKKKPASNKLNKLQKLQKWKSEPLNKLEELRIAKLDSLNKLERFKELKLKQLDRLKKLDQLEPVIKLQQLKKLGLNSLDQLEKLKISKLEELDVLEKLKLKKLAKN